MEENILLTCLYWLSKQAHSYLTLCNAVQTNTVFAVTVHIQNRCEITVLARPLCSRLLIILKDEEDGKECGEVK